MRPTKRIHFEISERKILLRTMDVFFVVLILALIGHFLQFDYFKVSKSKPTKDHTLQLLIYSIMGKKSIHKEFENIKKLGIYNPRLNIVYTLDMKLINKDLIETISSEVIGY